MSINSRTEKKVATAAIFQQEGEEEEEEEEGKKILKHLEKHLHVTNCIHISNHLHMQKKKRRNSSFSSPTTTTMLDSGRKTASSSSPHELPFIRELTAVKKKVKALRDPPATAYSSPNIYETEVDFTENRAGRGGQRGDGVLQPQHLAGRRIATQRNRLRHDDGSGVCSAKSTPTATTNCTWVDEPDDDDDDDGEAEEMGTRRRRTRGFVGNQEDDHHHHHQSPQWRRHQQLHTTTEEPPPTKFKRSRTTTRRGLPDASSRKLKEDDVNPKRLGIHSRERIRNPRAAVHHTTTRGQTESPEAAAAATAPHPPPHDALELSEMIPQQQQQGCGIPWYQSRVHKGKKGKRLLDFAGMGFTCAFPEAMMKKKVMDSKKQQQQASRNNGLGGSLRIEKSPSACDLLSDSGLTCSSGRAKAHNNIRHQDDGNGMRYSKASPSEEQYDDSLSGETLMHQSLSHKYRPKSFKDLVGQTLVVKALTTAITKGKIAPLYLFAGPHGTGKTSTARIFAAAVICHNTEPHRRPCGLCRECTTLTLNNTSSSSSQYVKEIDASNLELDHMRSVLHRMSLLSQSNSHHHHHHRVFIVECCEALSAEAWNAFLKFLDDPPRNMVFILITSDLEHLPLAATSRCQKFSFGRLKEMEIVTRLQFLATKDALEVDEAALSLIAARANGSLHDAETTLDQLSLLDRRVSLAMVEELVGLVSDKKLLELLDFALSANTTNTVRCLRELLDSGVDALSLVAQLASLITNILAGTSDVHSEMKGFSKRNFSKKEQQQRLRQALKVLAESEKQLRVSNDRPTWLTAALLQFAPDRSYLPSSVDTSMTPSPIAFDTFERITAAEAYTPRIQTSGDWILDTQKSQSLHQVVLTPKLPPTAIVEEKKERAAQQQPLCATTTTSHSEGKKKLPSGGKQSEAKVHPAESPMEKAGKSPLVATTSQLGSIVLFDGGRVAESRNFQVLGCQELEDVWVKVLHGCRSNVLRQLLQAHGTLISLCIAKVSHVEFQHVEQKARAERLRSSTCHAFQMALGCPVELKLSLSCPPTTVTEDSKTLHAMESTADSEAAAGPSNTTVHILTENSCSLSARQMQEALLGDQQQRLLAKKNQQHHGGLVGHTCIMNPDYVDQSQISRHQGCGCSPALENNPSEEVPQDVLEVMSRQKRPLCWKSSPPRKLKGKPNHRRSQRRVAFFLRMVPCTRSRIK
ncbi:unnamed protein product [Sphagnum troendelagicum]|uniref:AAA+ ATPase domain-containing protein n=1 Tax=Sphagnum troendelagicum TaxID=128251 RepID=A0ABP0UTZ4_9BRYO